MIGRLVWLHTHHNVPDLIAEGASHQILEDGQGQRAVAVGQGDLM